MSDKLRKLSECQLYGILDLSYVDNSEALPVAEGMIKGGVDLIQLRGKERPIEELVDLAAALQRHVAGHAIVGFHAPLVPTSESRA